MGIFLNKGIEEFKKTLNSQIYVDKTDIIVFLNRVVNTEQSCICVCRPRRFGKSVTVNMIAAYYEKGIDSRMLFDRKKLSEIDGWDNEMNKYRRSYSDRMTITVRQVTITIIQLAHFLLLQEMESRK